MTWGVRIRGGGLALLGVAFLCGCSTPVGVTRLGERSAYAQIARSALISDHYSSFTASVLHRYNLQEAFDKAPLDCIRKLHAIAAQDERRDPLFALAELCYLRASKAPVRRKRSDDVRESDYYLGAAVYAYLYLLGDVSGEPPSPYDRRFRMACDLYNRSLVPALIDRDGQLSREDRVYALPAGRIHLDLPEAGMTSFGKLVSADRYLVHGLSVRNRNAGLGAPIIAVSRKTADHPYPGGLASTVFLRVDGGVADLTRGEATGFVTGHSAFDGEGVTIGNVTVPLETDLSTHLAYTLDNPLVWKLGKTLFLKAETPIKSGLYPIQPYTPGKIPVVFVHGTMSSPVWWAEMLNTLRADPKIRDRYQSAFYLYDSGKPIVFSAVHMRDALAEYVHNADPEKRDGAMQQMVLVGHSQGGLLIKLCVTDTGDRLQRLYIDEDIETTDATAEEKGLLRRYTHFKSLPFVTRAVFISTPHRGSYLAGNLMRKLTRRFMRMPRDVMDTGEELLGLAEKHDVPRKLKSGMPTSIDSMSPNNPTLLALAEMHPARHVQAHSIIAIKGDDQPPDGKDGVVAYTSAHLDDVESELIVSSGHSCQQHPVTIEEVRRILLRHIEQSNPKPQNQ